MNVQTALLARPRPTAEQLALIYESVSDAIMLVGVEPGGLRVAAVNPAFTAATGMPAAHAVGRLLLDIADHPERPSRFRDACSIVARDARAVRFEEHTEYRGKHISALVHVSPIIDERGVVTHVLSVSRDMTQETRVLEALRAGEQSLEATLLSIGDGVIATDIAGNVVRMNPVAESTTGFSLGEARGRPLDEIFRIIDGKSRAPLPSPAVAALREARNVELLPETVLVSRGGVERAVAASAAPIRNVGGVCGVVLVYRDVTPERRAAAEKKVAEAERRRTETALRESEARYRTQFEHAPEAIVTLDVDIGRFVEANGNALRLFGYSREELLHIGPLEVSPPKQPDGRLSWEGAAEHIARTIGGESPVFEWTCVDKEGRHIPCEIRLVRLPGAGMQVRASFIDVTERKQAEELRRQSTALLEENRLIQAANRLKSEFVANMSHELRTPLNAILGFAELLHDGKIGAVSSEQRDCLTDVLASGRHLLMLINGMLDLAKVESGRMELVPEPLKLQALVVEVTDVVRALAARKRLRIDVDVGDGIDEVVLDAARLKQVLFNYLSNALKFTPEGGRVIVRAKSEDEQRFRVEVEDSGVGIREQDHGKLFIEFSQLDAGMTKTHEGTGLGLALTKRIVEAQGGAVGVRSAPGTGSTFFAILPKVHRT